MIDAPALRALKSSTSSWLLSHVSELREQYGALLDGTDARIMQYCEAVISAPDDHNLYEILGVRRFFGLLSRYVWRAGRVRAFFAFYERLKFSGLQGRRSYRLTPVQCFQFASIFGLYTPTGRRLTRTAYIFVPRKFSKTTSAAALAVYDMLCGDKNAQAYIGANSYDQAKICFDEIRAIMRGIDPKEKSLRINRERITFRGGGRDSLIQCLSANVRTKDGLNASLIIMDEYAQARNTKSANGADLKNVLTSSMGARENPLTVIITTASDVLDGPFRFELAGVKSVLRGETSNDSLFASLFEPDVDDAEDDPHTWRKVQPHIGVTIQPDFYASEYQNARLSASNMLAFRTKLLNVFATDAEKDWLNEETARRLLGTFDIRKYVGGAKVAVAYDLSVHDDFSAVSYCLWDKQQRRFRIHTDYYFPEGSLPGHPNEQLYRRWVEGGHLRLCSGAVIDCRKIADDIIAISRRLPIVAIGYDAYKAQELRNILATAGGPDVLRPFGQTNGSFNLPVEIFEMRVYADPPTVELNDNPINVYCLSNCTIDEDKLGNRKPMKRSQNQKIDGAITMLMSIGLLNQTYQ